VNSLDVAMCVVRSPDGRFLALRKAEDYVSQDRYAENRWETPGGKIEAAETAVEAAVRELQEETSLGAEPMESGAEVVDERPSRSVRITFKPVFLRARSMKVELSAEHSGFEWLRAEEFRDRLPEHNVEAVRSVGGVSV
jgi:ADP-ribose pyrophosphatase